MAAVRFRTIKKSERSGARLGVIETPHGEIETPTFVPVATRASVKTLTSETVEKTGAQVLIANTFHLHFTPGEDVVKRAGGLHAFMRWDKPLMTDSGGFQVLSMGFGREHSTGMVAHALKDTRITAHDTPSTLRITEDGVEFRSPLDGSKCFIGPRESIGMQESLGADIIFAFDEATSPLAERAYLQQSLARTHRWAKESLAAHTRGDQGLFGIVQGSEFDDLREESARVIAALPFAGFGIGGEYGIDKPAMEERVRKVTALLPEEKPRHLLGVGHPDDFAFAARGGADTFDCIAPTHYARHGTAFTSEGKLNMRKREYLSSNEALDPLCSCPVCTTYSRAYITHLIRAHEITGLALLSEHNLHYFDVCGKNLRRAIAEGNL